jgi:hypothetical protein
MDAVQLELGLTRAQTPMPACIRGRGSRAAWWFQRMREVVDHAVEWSPAPPARPQQTWLPNTHREISV